MTQVCAFTLKIASIIRDHPVSRSLQGALSVYRGRSSEGRNSELMRDIDEILNATGWWCWYLKWPISFLRDHIPFGFGTKISLDAKNRSVPQFIGAPQHNFETADLGIESSVPLAPGGWVNSSHTLVPATETIHRSRPPRTEESPRFSKCVLRSNFRGS